MRLHMTVVHVFVLCCGGRGTPCQHACIVAGRVWCGVSWGRREPPNSHSAALEYMPCPCLCGTACTACRYAEQYCNDIADLLAPQSGAYYDVWLDGEKFYSHTMEVGGAPLGAAVRMVCRRLPHALVAAPFLLGHRGRGAPGAAMHRARPCDSTHATQRLPVLCLLRLLCALCRTPRSPRTAPSTALAPTLRGRPSPSTASSSCPASSRWR